MAFCRRLYLLYHPRTPTSPGTRSSPTSPYLVRVFVAARTYESQPSLSLSFSLVLTREGGGGGGGSRVKRSGRRTRVGEKNTAVPAEIWMPPARHAVYVCHLQASGNRRPRNLLLKSYLRFLPLFVYIADEREVKIRVENKYHVLNACFLIFQISNIKTQYIYSLSYLVSLFNGNNLKNLERAS